VKITGRINGTPDNLSSGNTLCSGHRFHALGLMLGQLDLGSNHIASTDNRFNVLITFGRVTAKRR
jgi:hypothetical protein